MYSSSRLECSWSHPKQLPVCQVSGQNIIIHTLEKNVSSRLPWKTNILWITSSEHVQSLAPCRSNVRTLKLMNHHHRSVHNLLGLPESGWCSGMWPASILLSGCTLIRCTTVCPKPIKCILVHLYFLTAPNCDCKTTQTFHPEQERILSSASHCREQIYWFPPRDINDWLGFWTVTHSTVLDW